jgi:hydrogenase-4 component E
VSALDLMGLNSFLAMVFLLLSFVLMAARQIQAVLRAFVWQSIVLALSTFILAIVHRSPGLFLVGLITLVSKVAIIPAVINRTLTPEMRRRREIEIAVNLPTSLLLMLALTAFAYFLVAPYAGIAPDPAIHLPVGFAAVLIGVYTLAVRREAVAQVLALMAIDNGAFFAGIAITTSSAIEELAAGLEGVMVVVVVAILTRAIAQHLGGTDVRALAALREGGS